MTGAGSDSVLVLPPLSVLPPVEPLLELPLLPPAEPPLLSLPLSSLDWVDEVFAAMPRESTSRQSEYSSSSVGMLLRASRSLAAE